MLKIAARPKKRTARSYRPRRSPAKSSYASGRRFEVFVEPGQRALPGEFGSGLVIARRRVIVEAVVGGFVNVTFVNHLCGRQCLVEGRPSRIDALVEFAIMRRDRRLDLGRVFRARLAAVIRSCRGEI